MFPQLAAPGPLPWSKYLPGSTAGNMMKRFAEVIKTGVPLTNSLVESGPFTETHKAVFVDVKVIKYDAGYLATWRNVAQEIRHRRELEESRQMLADVLSLTEQPIGRCTPSGNLTWCNATYLKLAGVDTLSDALGKPVWELFQTIAADDKSDPVALRLGPIGEHLQTNDSHHLRGQFGNSLGEVRFMEWISRPLRDEHGDITQIQFVGSDITHWQESTDVLRDINRLLARSREQERQRVAARLHDDALQYLVAASWELDGASFSTEASVLIKQAITGVNACLKEIVPAAVHLDPIAYLIQDKVASLRSSGVKVATRLEQPSTEAALVLAVRVILVALDNVEQHSNASNVSVTVSLDEELVRVTVTDDGAGYDSFSAERAAASGRLSLISLQALVEANDGRIDVALLTPTGTSLTARIPAQLDVFK
jgi:signal transduction histidine kinase